MRGRCTKKIQVVAALSLMVLGLSACAGTSSADMAATPSPTGEQAEPSRTPTPEFTAAPTITPSPTPNPWEQGNPGSIRGVRDMECAAPCEVLAVAAEGGVFLLDPSDYADVGFLRSDAAVHSVAASPDGRLLAMALVDRLMVFDLLARVPVLEIGNTRGASRDLSFTPDGSVLAAAGQDEAVLWSPQDGSQIAVVALPSLTVPGFEGHRGSVYRMMISPDGTYLAVVPATSEQFEASWRFQRSLMSLSELLALNAAFLESPLPRILVWSLSDGSASSFLGEAAWFSPDGRALVSTWAGAIELREPGSATPARSIEAQGVGSAVEDIALSQDGDLVAVASWLSIGCDAPIGIWEIGSGDPVWRYCYDSELPAADVSDNQSRTDGGIVFSPEGEALFVWRYGALLALSVEDGSVIARIGQP